VDGELNKTNKRKAKKGESDALHASISPAVPEAVHIMPDDIPEMEIADVGAAFESEEVPTMEPAKDIIQSAGAKTEAEPIVDVAALNEEALTNARNVLLNDTVSRIEMEVARYKKSLVTSGTYAASEFAELEQDLQEKRKRVLHTTDHREIDSMRADFASTYKSMLESVFSDLEKDTNIRPALEGAISRLERDLENFVQLSEGALLDLWETSDKEAPISSEALFTKGTFSDEEKKVLTDAHVYLCTLLDFVSKIHEFPNLRDEKKLQDILVQSEEMRDSLASALISRERRLEDLAASQKSAEPDEVSVARRVVGAIGRFLRSPLVPLADTKRASRSADASK
jgi:hypothetical protein